MLLIRVEKIGDLYVGRVIRDGAVQWEVGEPLTASQLVELLKAQGCHLLDIGDAFTNADPTGDWMNE
jgi:hypothetical protein